MRRVRLALGVIILGSRGFSIAKLTFKKVIELIDCAVPMCLLQFVLEWLVRRFVLFRIKRFLAATWGACDRVWLDGVFGES